MTDGGRYRGVPEPIRSTDANTGLDDTGYADVVRVEDVLARLEQVGTVTVWRPPSRA